MKTIRNYYNKKVKLCLSKQFIALAFALLCVAAATYANGGFKGFVNPFAAIVAHATGSVIPESINIRSQASSSAEVISTAKQGDTLTILSEIQGSDGNTWYQVQVNADTKGYVRSDLVNKSETAPIENPVTTTSETSGTAADDEVVAKTGKVKGSSVNVRSEASTNGQKAATLPEDTVISIVSKTTGADGKTWYKISAEHNGSTVSGYVRSDFVSLSDVEQPPATEIDEPNPDEVTEPITEEPEEVQPDTFIPLEPLEDPIIPKGFKEAQNDEGVRVWVNGDYVLLYARTKEGNTGFYMYDQLEDTLQRYLPAEPTDGGGQKILIAVLGGLSVILLIAVTILLLKVSDYKRLLDDEQYEDDDDDDDDDDRGGHYRHMSNDRTHHSGGNSHSSHSGGSSHSGSRSSTGSGRTSGSVNRFREETIKEPVKRPVRVSEPKQQDREKSHTKGFKVKNFMERERQTEAADREDDEFRFIDLD